ncbi:MAG: NUDIX hydrolase [Simkania sp.]|nr:NUDIX hydrolase [Simkania sp.]
MSQKSETRAQLEKEAHIERQKIHEGRIITLAQDQIQYENGQEKTFDIVLHPGAVAMIPINAEGKMILVKQWRRAARQILLELPAGTLEAAEDPLECAQRELQEEIGFEARSITSLGGFFTAPGFCNEYIYLFLAKDLHPNPLVGDDSEEIDTVALTLEEAMEMIDQNEIVDAKTIAGIYRYNGIVS